ncbi:carbon-nitrogen hydrolase family protein [Pelagimonas varians]|uniref:(R)-stereoselective amidase n=1 Tax=Pelagimonas varians TaxID=696760 RepID=A0A238L501_9RHOB|nr:carbon-nitrogen hydrolase family protein [Pelagimonas varians]PYG26590.1 putative amidohydrolase [Pelagimonas varians]SMX49472.1 (R)-stereoselective amidase [Pelagimonas varians]
MRVAILQMTSSDDPEENLASLRTMLRDAIGQGAQFALTPEVTNIVSFSRKHQEAVLVREAQDLVLKGLQAEAKALDIWILAGSLALKSEAPETRFANRSLLINPEGEIEARYDKIHMFDVAVSAEETYRESAGFAPGDRAVLAHTGIGNIGLTICYDVRFGYLHRALAQAGAQIITAPAAFSPGTGPAHWQPLLQARAIETGCYILAPAQTGKHKASAGKSRSTYGHSMVVSPWGEVLLDAGTDAGVFCVDIDLAQVDEARRKVPSLTHDRSFEAPK